MSRLQREALVIVIDVGKNSSEMSGKSGLTFFERAKDCVRKILLRKIFTKPNDEAGIILFGCGETKNDLNNSQLGFENIIEIGHMQVATWDVLKNIDENIKQNNENSDWVEALLVAINYMKNETEAKKFSKSRILLFTNFTSEIDDQDLEVIISNISDNGIELIGISDTVQYENSTQLNSCQFSQNPNKNDTQSKSERIFETMTKQIDEGALLCHIDYVETQLLHFQKKTTRSMPWNAALTIGSQFSINVSGYVYIQDEKYFNTFKTECADPRTMTKMVTEYSRNNEIIQKPDEEDVVKAYMYGSKLVACDDPDLAYKSGSKCLSCLAFCKRDSIPSEYFIGDGCHIVVPQKGFEKSSVLYSALVDAMESKNYALIARKVYRDNTKPLIVALIPKIEDEVKYFVMIELPYNEDVQHLVFPRLGNSKKTEPSTDQIKAMEDLISRMDLTDAIDNDSGITEAFTLENLLNPYHQNMCKAVAFRALNPNEPLPLIDMDLMKLIDTPEKIRKQTEEFIEEFEALFPREFIEKREKKPMGQAVNDRSQQVDDTDIFEAAQADEEIKMAIGTVTPAEDLIYLVKKGTNRFTVLCEQIQTIIHELIFKTCTQFEDKLKECILAFREVSKIHGPFNYNKWITELRSAMISRDKINDWNNIIVKEGLGLISINESPISTVSIEDQLGFYETFSKDSSSRNDTSTLMEEDEDLEALL